ncbi:unnamed protein product, partial [marine sediment metagenome]
MYEKNGTWTLDQEIDILEIGSQFGCSVSICNGYIAVGADQFTGSETWSGKVYLYQKSTNWIEIAKFTAD